MEIVSMQFFMALGSIILLDILLGGEVRNMRHLYRHGGQ